MQHEPDNQEQDNMIQDPINSWASEVQGHKYVTHVIAYKYPSRY